MGDTRTESDIFRDRVERDLIAIGNFSANDIINHSVSQEEFTHLEPGLFDQQKKQSQFSNLKEAKKSRQNQQRMESLSTNLNLENQEEDDSSDFSGYKLPLFNADRT